MTFHKFVKKIYDECLFALKNTRDTADIAEYYIAMRYYFDMINNGEAYADNAKIGLYMLCEFGKLGNIYAQKVFELFEKFEESTKP